MKPLTIKEYLSLGLPEQELVHAFIDGIYFNLFDASKLFSENKKAFQEEIFIKGYWLQAEDRDKREYIQHVAVARLKATESMKKVLAIQKAPIEFFDDYNDFSYSNAALEIIQEYRNQKKLAYAILY